MVKSATKKPLAVSAYENIVKKIVSLEYQPSQHLEETQLVEELKIGRTPVREALVRLQGEKMVESHPNKGMIVRPITLQNTKAMFESMIIIEQGVVDVAVNKDCSIYIKEMRLSNEAARQAILSNRVFRLVEANHEFHMNFAACSRNEFLIRAVNDVRNEAKRLSYLSYGNTIDPDRPLKIHYDSVVTEHDQIIQSLEEKNSSRLKKLLHKHIETFRQRIILFMTS
ncbi:GntR family transcriptional regulator [Desulfospira joergensenii]|uniref:GntR family transcriptional regulator n=1 Tax=Desulfospira joergensenii TaxID=53329 RepID=UPI0003B6C4D2|nr:GntR family transcriptional regulator [Desulfospira joergensenii]